MLLDIIIVALGFTALIWGADKFVLGASVLATRLDTSPVVVGLTIMAFGTSAPEIFSAALAALADKPELAVGNALGSNLFNVGIALGVAAVIAPLRPPDRVIRKELPALVVVTALAGLLLADFALGMLDSLVLIGLTAYFGYRLARARVGTDILPLPESDAAESPPLWQAAAFLILGLALLFIGAGAVVKAASAIAGTLGVSTSVIGLTVVALGTSLPELAATVACALRSHHGLAIGNIIGSNILNLLATLPFPGLLAPGTVEAALVLRDYPAMLLITALLVALCHWSVKTGQAIGRRSGIAFLSIYLGWFILMFLQTIG